MGAVPDPWRKLSTEVRAIKEQLRRLGNASPFFGTGMHPNGDGGIDSDNFIAGASGYSFKANGNAEFNDLTLRGGIIGNDALTEPISAEVVNASVSNFSVNVVDFSGDVVPTVVTHIVTAPAGFTRALVNASSWGTAVNPNTTGGSNAAGGDFLLSRTYINGAASRAYPFGISGSNGQNSASSGLGSLVTVAPGGSFQIRGQLGSGFQDFGAANTNNQVALTATIIWLR